MKYNANPHLPNLVKYSHWLSLVPLQCSHWSQTTCKYWPSHTNRERGYILCIMRLWHVNYNTHSDINVKSKRAGMLSVITNHLTFTDFANEVAFYHRFERGVWGSLSAKSCLHLLCLTRFCSYNLMRVRTAEAVRGHVQYFNPHRPL